MNKEAKAKMEIHFHNAYKENAKICWFFFFGFSLLLLALAVASFWVAFNKYQGYLTIFLFVCNVVLLVVAAVILSICYKVFVAIKSDVPFLVITAQGLQVRPFFSMKTRDIKWFEIKEIVLKEHGTIEIPLKTVKKGFFGSKSDKITLLDVSEMLPEDLVKILMSAQDGFVPTVSKEDLVVCVDNLAYSRLNKRYNFGLLLVTFGLIVGLFIMNVWLALGKESLKWLLIAAVVVVFVLRLLSVRFDKKAPRNLTLTPTELKIGVIVARNMRHRRVGEIVLAREKISSIEFIQDGIIINITGEEPMVLNNLFLQAKHKEILRQAFMARKEKE